MSLRSGKIALVVLSLFTALCLFLLMSLASTPFRGIWLPTGLGVAVTLWLGWLPRFGDSWLRVLTGLSYSFGVLTLWLRSQPLIGSDRWSGIKPLAITFCAFLTVVLLFLAILTYVRRSPQSRPPVWPLFSLFLCGWLVAFFSSSKGGPDPMINDLMSLFHLSRQGAESLTIGIRKTIHFSFYGLLGLTGFLLARTDKQLKTAVWLGLALVLCHASYDETRQSSFSNRTGSAYDVILDMIGATAFISLGYRTTRLRASRST